MTFFSFPPPTFKRVLALNTEHILMGDLHLYFIAASLILSVILLFQDLQAQ